MRYVSFTLTLFILTGFWLDVRDHPDANVAAPQHERLKAMIEAFPTSFDGWVGVDESVPAEARKLLRPNALLSRRYRDDRGRQATLVVVHSRDARDMGGHYPPVCYPANGWRAGEPAWEDGVASVEGTQIGFRVYRFTRPSLAGESGLRVYSFFIIPGRGFARGIEAVRNAAGDYRLRPFGAAQVQVVFSDALTEAQSGAIFEEFVRRLAPTLRALNDRPEGVAS